MSKESFVWDEETIADFAHYWKHEVADYNREYVKQGMENFKSSRPQSKTPKREWEILSYVFKPLGIVIHPHSSHWELAQSGHPDASIHSVGRTSDNEVFTVGDDVAVNEGDHEWRGKIYELKVLQSDMIVGIWQNGETNPTGDLHRTIEMLTKFPPQPKPEQPKRIEVTFSKNKHYYGQGVKGEYRCRAYPEIPEEKFPAIKEAIENCLNDKVVIGLPTLDGMEINCPPDMVPKFISVNGINYYPEK